MDAFSSAIKLDDVSDFIAPSQACVVGLGAANPSGAPKVDAGDAGVVPSARPSSLASAASAAVSGTAPVPRPSIPSDKNAPVKVTLNDCLACSGCVTSAETVLLEAQSTAELDAALLRANEGKTAVVVTLSQQSVASLALAGRKRGERTLTPSEAAAALSWALREAGAAAVVDAGEPRALSLLASAAEFCAVYAASPEGKAALRRFAPRSKGGSGSETEEEKAAEAADTASRSANAAAAALGLDVSSASSRLLPCLASACPGWVCYAEKNAASAALPHAASAASSQAVSGLLIKRALLARAARDERGADEKDGGVFHVSVMPCADKKLESLRDDLVVGPGSQKRENEDEDRKSPPGTDCVLTTIELRDWLSSRHGPGFDLSTCPRAPLDSLSAMLQGGVVASRAAAEATSASGGAKLSPSAGTSGGLAEFVFRHAASTLFGVDDLPRGPLPWKAGRNGDVREVVLEMREPGKRKRLDGEVSADDDGDGEKKDGDLASTVVLRASLHYGFRNIQTLVSRIRSGASHALPHYVEVMACPSGCVNGGGQLRAAVGVSEAATSTAAATTSAAVDGRTLASEVYSSLSEDLRPAGSDWYASTLSSARALAGVAWPRGKVEPVGSLSARVRDRKAEAAAAEEGERSGGGAPAAAAAPMSVDW